MTPHEANERVARGTALLDLQRPGWASLIDVSRTLGVPRGSSPAHGFDLSPREWNEQTDLHGADYIAFWQPLKDAWIAAIAERLTPAVQRTHRTPAGAVSA